MYKIINTFNDVEVLVSNILIICDIDETLLTWNKKPSQFLSYGKRRYLLFQ